MFSYFEIIKMKNNLKKLQDFLGKLYQNANIANKRLGRQPMLSEIKKIYIIQRKDIWFAFSKEQYGEMKDDVEGTR